MARQQAYAWLSQVQNHSKVLDMRFYQAEGSLALIAHSVTRSDSRQPAHCVALLHQPWKVEGRRSDWAVVLKCMTAFEISILMPAAITKYLHG